MGKKQKLVKYIIFSIPLYLNSLYETEIKKIIKIQAMARSLLIRKRSQSATEPRQSNTIFHNYFIYVIKL